MSFGMDASSSSNSMTWARWRARSKGVSRTSRSLALSAKARFTGQHELYWLSQTMSLPLPLDYTAIERILPHRYPFLLVDRVTEFEPDRRIVGVKNVSLN